MIVPIKIDKKNAYYTIYRTIAKIKEWEITEYDIKVFATILNKLVALRSTIKDSDTRMKYLFSKNSKQDMIIELKTSYNSFANALTKLRKVGLINGNTLNEQYAVNIDNNAFILKLQFAIKDGNR